MKKNFMTGLVMILPLTLTIIILDFMLDLVTKPFVPSVAHLLNYFHVLDGPFYIFTSEQIVRFLSRFIALVALILLTLILGFIGNLFLYQTVVRVPDALFKKIPFLNKVYKACQDVVVTICHKDKPAFSQVVMVPFPHEGVMSIGLITRNHATPTEEPKQTEGQEKQQMVSVFIPATPNPTFGFMLVFKPEQLTPLDITVQQALTYIVSAGTIMPQAQSKQKT